MKKMHGLIIRHFMVYVVFFSAYPMQAQYTYSLTTLSQPYANLVDATVISPAEWDFTFATTVPIGFTFPFFNQTFNGNLIVVSGELALGVVDNTNYFIDAFTNMDMASRGNGLSPISYIVNGSVGDRILKIEWQNAGYPDSDPATYFNVQAWLYENGTVELHYGASNVSNADVDNTQIGLIKIAQVNPELLHLAGSPTSPSLVNNIDFLTSMPPDGTVYKFTKTITGVKNLLAGEKNIKVYPNPTKGEILISSDNTKSIEIYNSLGEKVYDSSTSSPSSSTIDLSSQPNGLYVIKVKTGDYIFTEKLLKQ